MGYTTVGAAIFWGFCLHLSKSKQNQFSPPKTKTNSKFQTQIKELFCEPLRSCLQIRQFFWRDSGNNMGGNNPVMQVFFF